MEKQSKSFDFDDEKRLTVREKEMGQGIGINLSMLVDKDMSTMDVGAHRFGDDLSAVAEEEEVMSRSSVALTKTISSQTTPVKTGSPRIIEYRKL